MNTRFTILNNLLEQMKTISKANGYQNDYPLVDRKFKSWDACHTSEMPSLFLLDDGRETRDEDEQVQDSIFVGMYPVILGYVHDARDVSARFGTVDGDLKRFLYSGLDLGSNCKWIEFEGYDAIITLDKLIVFQARIYIFYDFLKADP
jgi:hypothetical protein